MTTFTLQPFAPPHPEITLTGTVVRDGDHLAIAYRLSDPLAQVTLPSPSPSPNRRYDLWETTCFEFFLGLPHQPHYWEFNLSPSGDWNLFHLDAYRQNLKEAPEVRQLPFAVETDDAHLTLSLTFDLTSIMASTQPLDMAICAVIQTAQGSLSYWALTHCGPEADFHQRDSFILQI